MVIARHPVRINISFSQFLICPAKHGLSDAAQISVRYNQSLRKNTDIMEMEQTPPRASVLRIRV